jgi:hypothetical protein
MKKLFLLVLFCALSPDASFAKLSRQQQPPAPTATTQAPAQPPAVNPCDAPSFRQFDFWVGTWVVKDQKGNEIGKSEITKIANGCGIRENWNGGVGSNSGTSLNYFDKASGKWHQDWVGSGGMVLHLSGSFEKQAMSLSGERQMPKGRVLDRISWTLLPDGRVQQEWNISTDSGQTWKKTFDGYYSRQ